MATDHAGRPFTVGAMVRVTATGYGATLTMCQGTWRIESLGPRRAVLRALSAGYVDTYRPRVSYECMTVVP